MKKVLIIGASGTLGSVFLKKLKDNYHVRGTFNNNFAEKCSKLDIMDYRAVGEVFKEEKPHYVIHCAALANVDKCEAESGLAWGINEVGTENIAQYARKFNAKLVYISTDSVFDGEKGNYKETDVTHPINIYGKSKLQGEKVATWAKDYLVIRTAFFDRLAGWVIANLKDGKEISMFRDVYFSPICTSDLVDITLKMCEKELTGVYHVGGQGSWSKYEFGVNLAKVFNLNPDLIKRTLVGDIKERVPRPKRLSLDSSKAEKDLGIRMPTLKEGIARFKENYAKD